MATRGALRSAALQLVAERGLHHVTVEDIAEAADVSVRTFFNHFATKEEAVVGLDVVRAEQFADDLEARPAGEPPLDAVHRVLVALAERISAGDDDWLLRMEVVRRIPELAPRLLASFAAYERALVEAVARRTGMDPDTDLFPLCTAMVGIASFRSAMVLWHQRGHTGSLTALVDEAFSIAANGCTIRSGRADAGTPPPTEMAGRTRTRNPATSAASRRSDHPKPSSPPKPYGTENKRASSEKRAGPKKPASLTKGNPWPHP